MTVYVTFLYLWKEKIDDEQIMIQYFIAYETKVLTNGILAFGTTM